MWRLCRKTVFPRWHVNRQNPVENKNRNATCPKVLVLASSSKKKKYSGGNYEQKQHANKQDKRFWNDPQFQFNFLCSSVLETAGWLGTAAALCLNIHLKHIKTIYEYGRSSSCPFSSAVYAVPKKSEKKESTPLHNNSDSNFSRSEEAEVKKVSTNVDDILQDMQKLTVQYEAAVENAIGFACVDSNNKKAFKCFQTAARLGSSQGFYNLGICYELGKGTRVNLNRAAFCYKKAAMKGHGLASFNLAIYFFKGMGGLPVDCEAAKLLLTQAADKGVSEAQLYIAVEYLEEQKFSEAFSIFSNLAKKNILDGKYFLGLCYENGWGVDKNERVAAELFSQCAALGHQKAMLRLGKYYEEGRGGCDKDCDLAKSLYQMLADKGNKEAQKALAELKQAILLDVKKQSLNNVHQNKIIRSNMHTSLSVPELNATTNIKNEDFARISTPSYLDLMIPFFPTKPKEMFGLNKVSFYLEEKPVVKIPYNFTPCFQNMSPVMTAKT